MVVMCCTDDGHASARPSRSSSFNAVTGGGPRCALNLEATRKSVSDDRVRTWSRKGGSIAAVFSALSSPATSVDTINEISPFMYLQHEYDHG